MECRHLKLESQLSKSLGTNARSVIEAPWCKLKLAAKGVDKLQLQEMIHSKAEEVNLLSSQYDLLCPFFEAQKYDLCPVFEMGEAERVNKEYN